MSQASAPGASMSQLVAIMDRLLAPDGCPWDREQTLDTLRGFLVEETYEVIDAMVRNDVPGHCEELGDLLMQVVFQAAVRRAAGAFDIDAVVAGICEKLIRRHPHIFPPPGTEANTHLTAAEVLVQWDAIKVVEKAAKGAKAAGPTRALAGVPPGPALARAQQVGRKCGKIGFDWPGWEGSFAKVEEETAEVREAIAAGDVAATHAEVGDLLLAVVNLARKLDIDAENALIDASARFERRFAGVEDRLAALGKTPKESNLAEMDALWNDVKRVERGA